MTPFRRAREAAIALRRRYFGDLADSALASDHIITTIAAEDAEDFEITPTDPADEALGKADAHLVRTMRQILVRNDVSPAEQAFLAAHEFGHWKLHADDDGNCGQVIDTGLKPAADETQGAQKVEAYGVRERTELQANLFGRELLLPRAVACGLFLSGKNASAIAKEIDLPLELVRQQLLDALLLPEVEAPAEEPQQPIEPTPLQLAAARSTAPVSLVVAGPGTGKTTTLLLRVQHLLASGAKPGEILILTFGNRAARELADRLQLLGLKNAHEAWIGTFHAFGLEFLRKNHDVFKLPPRFGVADKMAQIAVLEPHIYGLGLEVFNPLGDPLDWLDDVVTAIQRAKDELADAAAYAEAAAKSAGKTPEDVQALQRDVARLYTCYQTQIQARGNLVDMGDLVMLPALALRDDSKSYTASVGRFKHVLVDEYQDVNRASAVLVKALAKPAKSLWVVGDARQAIYRFRGASMRNILEFGADFPKHKTFTLNENRRSHTEIVRVFEHTGRGGHPLQLRLPLEDVQAVRGASGVKPLHVQCAAEDIVLGELVAHAQRLHEDGVDYRDQVVLASTHETCGAAAQALNAAGVPALHLGDIFQRPEIRDVLALLQLFVDRSASSLVRVTQLPGFSLPAADVDRLLAAAKEDRPAALSWLRAPPQGLSAEGAQGLGRYAALLHGLKATDSPWDVACTLLLDRTDVLRANLQGDTMPDITRRLALWQFIYHLRVPDGTSKFQTVGGFLTALRRRLRIGDDRELRIPPPEADALDAVAVMTIHGSKGLEFQAVHLVDIDAWHFRAGPESPLVPARLLESVTQQSLVKEAHAEASNKLYVALSRAKNDLILYENTGRYNAACVDAVSQMPELLKRVEGTISLPARQIAAAPAPAGDQPHAVPLNGFLAYRICPRRYYYDVVKALTPASGMHPAALVENAVFRELFAEHGEEPGPPPGEVTRILRQLGADYGDSIPHLQAYADQLLAAGREWLGAERGAMGKPFHVTCAGLPVRVTPHRIDKAGQVVTLHFVRARPSSSGQRQQKVLRWLMKYLADVRPELSVSARIHVLHTGQTESAWPGWNSFLDGVAANLQAGDFAARPSARDCHRCRHFLYCPA